MNHAVGCRARNTGCDGDCDCRSFAELDAFGSARCPECSKSDAVDKADPMGLTAEQAGYRWWCERCNLVFGRPNEPAEVLSNR